jgi:hypothetical protein
MVPPRKGLPLASGCGVGRQSRHQCPGHCGCGAADDAASTSAANGRTRLGILVRPPRGSLACVGINASSRLRAHRNRGNALQCRYSPGQLDSGTFSGPVAPTVAFPFKCTATTTGATTITRTVPISATLVFDGPLEEYGAKPSQRALDPRCAGGGRERFRVEGARGPRRNGTAAPCGVEPARRGASGVCREAGLDAFDPRSAGGASVGAVAEPCTGECLR